MAVGVLRERRVLGRTGANAGRGMAAVIFHPGASFLRRPPEWRMPPPYSLLPGPLARPRDLPGAWLTLASRNVACLRFLLTRARHAFPSSMPTLGCRVWRAAPRPTSKKPHSRRWSAPRRSCTRRRFPASARPQSRRRRGVRPEYGGVTRSVLANWISASEFVHSFGLSVELASTMRTHRGGVAKPQGSSRDAVLSRCKRIHDTYSCALYTGFP